MTKELLTQFLSATDEFIATAESLSEEQLNRVPAPGEWSAAHVIHHLADSDAHFLVRFLNLLSVDKPEIVPFDEEAFPTSLHYEGRTVATSLHSIKSSAAHANDILSQITDKEWSRSGFHPQRGEMSLTDVLQLTTNHRVGHIDQLKASS